MCHCNKTILRSRMPIPRICMNNGLSIPVFGLGTWNNYDGPEGQIEKAVGHSIDAGYRLFDCAAAYANEHEVGNAISKKIQHGVVKREDLFIVTKVWMTCMRSDFAELSVQKSLKKLNMSYVDLLLIHWPLALQEGDDILPKGKDGKVIYSSTDYLETWKVMEKCVETGLTKSIGVSNFNEQQLERLLKHCVIKPVTNQVECHPYLTQKPLINFLKQNGMFLMAYTSLGRPGSSHLTSEDPILHKDPVVVNLAKKYGKSETQILIRYQIDAGNVVIPKSSSETRIRSNIDVFDFELTTDDISQLENLNIDWRFVQLPWLVDHPEYPWK